MAVKIGKRKAVAKTAAKPNKVVGKTAKAVTTVEYPDGATKQDVQTVETIAFDEPPCNVGVNAGLTINTGNYNSVRIGVSLNMPCKEDDIEETFARISHWVDGKMSEMHEKVTSEL